MVKEFEYFLKKGDVKKQSIDQNTSKATFKDAKERLTFAKSLYKKVQAKYVLENAYEAMREAADAVLYSEGFKSYSHEASIVYLLKKNVSYEEISDINRFRKIRNGIKYYGKDCDQNDAKDALILAEKIIRKIERILK